MKKQSINIETFEDAIATKRTLITRESFVRFADKNYLTPSIVQNYISSNGLPLDVAVLDLMEISNFQDESTAIDRFIDFILEYPTAAKIKEYIDKRKKEQATTKTQSVKSRLTNDEIKCYIKKAKYTFPNERLKQEVKEYIDNPSFYFGPLFELPSCKMDLFNRPVSEQTKVIKELEKELDSSSINKPKAMATRKKTTKRKPAAKKKVTAKRKPAAKKTVKRKTTAKRKPAAKKSTTRTVSLKKGQKLTISLN